MTDSLYFEADDDRSLELATLSANLGVNREDLLNEALEMLLAAYRDRQTGAEPIGLLADLHGVQGRIRAMVQELEYIRFTTSSSPDYESGVSTEVLDSLRRHYEKIFNSSERALKAAGFGPFFRPLPLEDEEASESQSHGPTG